MWVHNICQRLIIHAVYWEVIISKWGESLNDPVIATAILDRLLHHSHIIQIDGPSYRTKDILYE